MNKPDKGKEATKETTTTATRWFSLQKKILFGVATAALIVSLAWLPAENMADTPVVTVYKSPTCGCCSKWIDHLEEGGFKVIAHDRQDMNHVKESYGIDPELRSCHTATVDAYVIEGHVPVGDIHQLLKQKPNVAGLAVPGMPMGSPGMEGSYRDPYEVIVFGQERNRVFARH